MKNLFFSTVSAACIFAASACNNPQKEPAKASQMQVGDVDNVQSVLYPADSAMQNIGYFDALCDTIFQGQVPIKAFNVRAVDLLAALGMPEGTPQPLYDHIRVYLGYKDSVGFKLYIVPVDSASLLAGEGGKDILLDSTGHGVAPLKRYYDPSHLGNKFVLDLNTPCPSTCDIHSPLMSN